MPSLTPPPPPPPPPTGGGAAPVVPKPRAWLKLPAAKSDPPPSVAGDDVFAAPSVPPCSSTSDDGRKRQRSSALEPEQQQQQQPPQLLVPLDSIIGEYERRFATGPEQQQQGGGNGVVVAGEKRPTRPSTGATPIPAPPWVPQVPQSLQVKVFRNSELLDQFDASEGLWALTSSGVVDDELQDVLTTGDCTSTDARDTVWAAAQRRVMEGRRIREDLQRRRPKGPTVARSEEFLPPSDHRQCTVCLGKDTARCTVAIDHPSVSRLHAQLTVGALLCRPDTYTTTEDLDAAVAKTLALYLLDPGSSNGTFLSRDGSTTVERVQHAVPVRLDPGVASVITLGASSRRMVVEWTPVQQHARAGASASPDTPSLPHLPPVAGGMTMAPRPARRNEEGHGIAVNDVDDQGTSAFAAAQTFDRATMVHLVQRKGRITEALQDAYATNTAEAGAAQAKQQQQRIGALERDLAAVEVAIARRQASQKPLLTDGVVRRRVVTELSSDSKKP